MKLFVFGLLACASVQAVLLGPISVGGIRPDLFLLLIFLVSPRVSPEAATIQGFLVGLCQDALSGGPLGLRAFTYSLIGCATAWLSHDLHTEKPLAQFWLLLAGASRRGRRDVGPPGLLPGLCPAPAGPWGDRCPRCCTLPWLGSCCCECPRCALR